MLLPSIPPIYTPLTLADVTAALKNVTFRNQIISRTSVNLGFENSGSTLFTSNLNNSYAAATAISGTLNYPQTLKLQSRYTTVVAFNEGGIPGPVAISANGGYYAATDQFLIASKSGGLGSYFRITMFQIPIGFYNLTNISATFNKTAMSVKNTQLLMVLPGLWTAPAASAANGGANSGYQYTSLAVIPGDLVFTVGSLSRPDASIPTIAHGGTAASTRIIETSSTYSNTSGQQLLASIDVGGTYTSNAGVEVVTTSGGGGHGGGGTITNYYFYDTYSIIFRFVSP